MRRRDIGVAGPSLRLRAEIARVGVLARDDGRGGGNGRRQRGGNGQGFSQMMESGHDEAPTKVKKAITVPERAQGSGTAPTPISTSQSASSLLFWRRRARAASPCFRDRIDRNDGIDRDCLALLARPSVDSVDSAVMATSPRARRFAFTDSFCYPILSHVRQVPRNRTHQGRTDQPVTDNRQLI